VMYALADYIGEDNVNRALRAYRDEWALKGPPYSTTKDLLAEIRKVTPAPLAYVIDDFFDTITFYDNRALEAAFGGRDRITHREIDYCRFRAAPRPLLRGLLARPRLRAPAELLFRRLAFEALEVRNSSA